MKMVFLFIVVSMVDLSPVNVNASKVSIHLDLMHKHGRTLKRFWTNTGFSPTPSFNDVSQFLLSKDEQQNLVHIGSVPYHGITHVRIHWLLDMVSASCQSSQPWKYDFANLDKLMETLHKNKLSPGFELMGNPSSCFSDGAIQVKEWRSLIHQLVERYLNMFGPKYVYSWRFETLNEPDLHMYNRMKWNFADYLSYVQASGDVLASFNLTLWGPAGLFKKIESHPLCWTILNHCNRYSCPFRVISFHKKGDGVASLVVKRGEELIQQLKFAFPNIRNFSFANNEADPLTGWIKPVEWRADVRYAAAVVQTIIGYIKSSQENNYHLAAISNDNGFLSYQPNFWTQRTLLARFQMNNTSPPHVQMFRKPVLSAMGMMAMLEGHVTSVKYKPGNPGLSYVSAAKDSRRSVLLTLNNDTLINEAWVNLTLNLELRLLLPIRNTEGRGSLHLLDNTESNPYQVWTLAGRPDFPDKLLRRKIREKEGSRVTSYILEANKTELLMDIKISVPSVILINICFLKEATPGPVSSLQYLNVTDNEIILKWNDAKVLSKCLQSFIVEFRPIKEQRFRKITFKKFLTTSYHFDGCSINEGTCDEVKINGHYRVAAMDYWDRVGPYSNILFVK